MSDNIDFREMTSADFMDNGFIESSSSCSERVGILRTILLEDL